jgi:hypothetical protein
MITKTVTLMARMKSCQGSVLTLIVQKTASKFDEFSLGTKEMGLVSKGQPVRERATFFNCFDSRPRG